MLELINKIIKNGSINNSDTVIDMGCGWRNVTCQLSKYAREIIGIEPNIQNLEEAKRRIKLKNIDNVKFIKGSFEKPNYEEVSNEIISSLVFHQLEYKNKYKALFNIERLLDKGGIFILCDLFDPIKEKNLFNKTYRYLIEKTTPKEIYEKYIKPYFEDDSYIYSWEDMKKYTPKKNQFHSINDLERLLKEVNMKVIKVDEICPFFGIISITKDNPENSKRYY